MYVSSSFFDILSGKRSLCFIVEEGALKGLIINVENNCKYFIVVFSSLQNNATSFFLLLRIFWRSSIDLSNKIEENVWL